MEKTRTQQQHNNTTTTMATTEPNRKTDMATIH